MRPAVSVIVVSDYASGTEENGPEKRGSDKRDSEKINSEKHGNDLRSVLGALARQEFKAPFEILLVESSALAGDLPSGLHAILPSLRVEVSSATTSYGLKNAGVRAATADLVALLDADCTPSPDWLQRALASMRADPAAVAVSGRTRYAGKSMHERLLAALSRAYLDPGHEGRTQFISNNNAIIRRDVFLQHPLPEDGGPFAARIQSEAIRRAGGLLRFEPAMCVVHDFEGWAMERDIRRNIGYSTVRIRQLDPGMPWSWLVSLGVASIPIFVLARTLDSCWDCLRAGEHYGMRWFELPPAFALAFLVHLMEIGGMVKAFNREEITTTAYR